MMEAMEEKRSNLFQLFLPIFLETLLLMASGIVDTFMLSSVPGAVGAVGTVSSYLSMFFIALTVISCGNMAVMTQNIGAKRPGVAYQARQIALAVNFVVGLLTMVALASFARPILYALGTADALLEHASTYMRIVAIGSFLDALTLIFCAYLRAFGHTRTPFVAAVSGNILNIGLNALFLFAFKWGVMGVAVATVIGKFLSLALATFFSYYQVRSKNFKERISRKQILKDILRIGFPAAIESISYSVAMMVVMSFINRMDVDGFNATAKAYVSQITNFSYCAAFALAQANAFLVGWRMGAKEYDRCYKGTRNVALLGIAIGVGVELIFALCGRLLAGIFTKDAHLIDIVAYALYIDIALEVGRASNLVFGQALKTSGYSLLPSFLSAGINAVMAIAGTYLFGVVLGYGVLGAMLALTLDECIRAIAMFILWKSRRWEKTKVVQSEENAIPASE